MDVDAKDATDSEGIVDAADVTADAVVDAPAADAASATTAACGSSFFSAAAAALPTDVAMAADAAMVTTAACGSSFFSAAAAALAMAAAIAVDVDARQLTFSCIGLKRRSHFPVSFFIYIYNADTGRSHHGRKTF